MIHGFDQIVLTLSTEEHAELKDARRGTKIHGKYEAEVANGDARSVSIRFTSFEINTENKADKSLREMRKDNDAPREFQSKETKEHEDEENAFI